MLNILRPSTTSQLPAAPARTIALLRSKWSALMCTGIAWSSGSNQRALRKDLIRQMVKCCRSLGGNRRPGKPDRSSFRSASPQIKFVQPALSDVHGLSTLLPEVPAWFHGRASQVARMLRLIESSHGRPIPLFRMHQRCADVFAFHIPAG